LNCGCDTRSLCQPNLEPIDVARDDDVLDAGSTRSSPRSISTRTVTAGKGLSMNGIVRWWRARSFGEQRVLIAIGSLALFATGGALAYAIATRGAVLIAGDVVVAVGGAAATIAKNVRR
jgi:hypothetical protein